jgi:hypothetical protein
MPRRLVLVLAVLSVLPLTWGCNDPPEVEVQQAQAALTAARTAEAQVYAPRSLTAAQDTLNAALAKKQEQDGKFVLFRRYEESRLQLTRAEGLAKKAESDSKAEKERVRQEVMDLLSTAKTELDAAAVALQTAPRGKGNKAELALIEAEMQGINTAYAEAKAEFDSGRLLTAKPKVTAVREQVQRITNEIATAAAAAKAPRR